MDTHEKVPSSSLASSVSVASPVASADTAANVSATPVTMTAMDEMRGAPKVVKAGGKKRGRKRTMNSADLGESKSRGGRNRTDSVASESSEPLLVYPVYDAGKIGASTGKESKEKETPRSVRLQSVQICQRVLNHLMCDGSLSMSELTTNIPEVSKDTLMAVLEVLDIMGIVMTFQAKKSGGSSSSSSSSSSKALSPLGSPPSTALAAASFSGGPGEGVGATRGNVTKGPGPPSSSSSLSSSPQGIPVFAQSLFYRHSGDTMYAMRDFTKGTEFTQFTGMKEQLRAKRSNIQRIHGRIKALDELTRAKQPHTRSERIAALRKLLTDLVTNDSALQDDQLYRAVMEQPSFGSVRR